MEIEFEDLDEDIQDEYLIEAFNSLSQNEIPYGIITGDEGSYRDWEPAFRLAKEHYNQIQGESNA